MRYGGDMYSLRANDPYRTYRKQTYRAKNYMEHTYPNPRSDELIENIIIGQKIILGTIILIIDQKNV